MEAVARLSRSVRLPRRLAADTLPAMILERIPEIMKLTKAEQTELFGELSEFARPR